MTASARGLFSATGKAPKPVAVRDLSGEIVKVPRLGLNGERVKPVSKPRAKKTAPHVPVTKTQIKKERLVLEVSEELPDVTDRIGLADVGHDECKWITGDPKKAHSYCAKPTKPGASWCPAHHRRVYRGRR